MNNLPDLILTFIVNLTGNPHIVLPIFIWIIASWRVARLRQMTHQNYQERVTESIADTIKKQMGNNLLKPLFEENGVQLPRGTAVGDIIERLVEDNPNNFELLSHMYTSLEQFGANSEVFAQAFQIVLTIG